MKPEWLKALKGTRLEPATIESLAAALIAVALVVAGMMVQWLSQL